MSRAFYQPRICVFESMAIGAFMNSREKGFDKEKEAARFLQKRGYKIIDANFRAKFGEIDIIARHKNDLVFIEVKYRKSLYAGTPQEAVTASKQKKIIKSALSYLKMNKIKSNVRFDIAAVNDEGVEIIESAFAPVEGQYYY